MYHSLAVIRADHEVLDAAESTFHISSFVAFKAITFVVATYTDRIGRV